MRWNSWCRARICSICISGTLHQTSSKQLNNHWSLEHVIFTPESHLPVQLHSRAAQLVALLSLHNANPNVVKEPLLLFAHISKKNTNLDILLYCKFSTVTDKNPWVPCFVYNLMPQHGWELGIWELWFLRCHWSSLSVEQIQCRRTYLPTAYMIMQIALNAQPDLVSLACKLSLRGRRDLPTRE